MKKKRHEAILRLIENNVVSTQEDLLQMLKDNGFEATQATVSRDIKELRLIKVMDEGGAYRYKISANESDELISKYNSIFSHSVISADYAGNIIAIRCYNGMANAACAAIDAMQWDGLVGTLAGDDTIFALCRTEEYAAQMKDAIGKLLSK